MLTVSSGSRKLDPVLDLVKNRNDTELFDGVMAVTVECVVSRLK
jgi:hypothetical protein